MLPQDRDQSRNFMLNAWHKHTHQQTLEPIEQTLVDIIKLHPEYYAIFDKKNSLQRDFPPEQTNPFLHISSHLALHEQLSIDQPIGIRLIYQQLLGRFKDPHAVEHQMLDCLQQAIWQAQQRQAMPDEQAYLACLKKI